jgi:hypothetical protein
MTRNFENLQIPLTFCLGLEEMCPHPNSDAPPNDIQEMVMVSSNGLNGNGTSHRLNGTATRQNGVNGHSSTTQQRNPYAPRASDFLNNVSNFKIIESTLRGSCFFFFSRFSLLTDIVAQQQRGSNLPMPSLTPTLKLRSPRPSTSLASSIWS